MFRSVHEDITFAGTAIPANSKVLLLLASANHDETHYPNPEEFVLDRFPRGFVDADHVAFQAGIHTCLGAPLAREFIAVYLDRLAERVAEVRQVGPMKRSINALVKCVEDLPVELVPR
jgi:cytochrome P450